MTIRVALLQFGWAGEFIVYIRSALHKALPLQGRPSTIIVPKSEKEEQEAPMAKVDSAAMALETERQIYDVVTPLEDSDRIGHAKVLLIQRLSYPKTSESQIILQPIATDEDWQHYTKERIAVESGLGVAEHRARAMVDELRQRAERVGMTMFFAVNRHGTVGAIGKFGLAAPNQDCARLQEVDVFPSWRGRGYGTLMLIEMLRQIAVEGYTTATIGADEDDWPLGWYRRHGFTDVLRVCSTRE